MTNERICVKIDTQKIRLKLTGLYHEFVIPLNGLCWPEIRTIEGRDVMSLPEIVNIMSDDKNVFDVRLKVSSDFVTEPTLHVKQEENRLVYWTDYKAICDHSLIKWQILPPGVRIPYFELIQVRHPGYGLEPFLRVPLTQAEGSTYSDDWNFAPHPSLFVFQSHNRLMTIGTLDLPHGFGFRLKTKNYLVNHFYLDMGDGVYRVRQGETVISPVFAVLFSSFPWNEREIHSEWVYHAMENHFQMARDKGYLPVKTRSGYSWWKSTHYCTWGDQVFLANMSGKRAKPEGFTEQVKQMDFALAHGLSPVGNLTSSLIDQTRQIILREKLLVGIYIIDDGWEIARGTWYKSNNRIPGLREKIDQLHSDGFKVGLWWAPFEMQEGSELIQHKEWLAESGKVLFSHGIPFVDYSNPIVQKEYLLPLLRRLLSGDPGCYDADLIKLDFTADKVQRHIKVYDRAWCGEEKFFHEFFRFVSDHGRQIKKDFCFFTFCPHPFLDLHQDMVLTSELWTADHLMHLGKARICQTYCPGSIVNYFSHGYRENLDKFFKLAFETGASASLYGVIGLLCEETPFREDEYQRLREWLKI